MADTAIVVPVPEAEPRVGRWRREHTPDGRDGMPAHVTLLYPFTESGSLDAPRVRELAEVVGGFSPFTFALSEVRVFDDSPRVLYLAPDPAAPFAAMTDALVDRFPEHRPYGGKYDETIPHVTVAVGADDLLARIEKELLAAGTLPVAAHAREVWLVEYVAGRWRKRSGFALDPATGP